MYIYIHIYVCIYICMYIWIYIYISPCLWFSAGQSNSDVARYEMSESEVPYRAVSGAQGTPCVGVCGSVLQSVAVCCVHGQKRSGMISLWLSEFLDKFYRDQNEKTEFPFVLWQFNFMIRSSSASGVFWMMILIRCLMIAVCHGVLPRGTPARYDVSLVAVFCNVLRCVAVCCILHDVTCPSSQCVAMYCNLLQCVASCRTWHVSWSQCVALCCSVLQFVASCKSNCKR